MRPFLLPFLLTLVFTTVSRADDLLPPDQPIEQVIDHYLDLQIKEAKVTPAPPADETTLVRRLMLDLVGRIPTMAETQAYLAADAGKRAQLVDRLIASPAFVRYQATALDVMLMDGTKGSVRDYLVRALTENRSWDQIFRELMLPNEADPQQKGASEFLRQRLTDVDKLTTEVSSLFFGVNVSCARCHDHPKVEDWKQDHFYGMKSFFNRTFDNGGFLAEREVGLVKFKTTKGQEKQARLMFLTGKVVDDPNGLREPTKDEERKDKARFEELKKNKTAPPPPNFSARARFVDVALQPGEARYFARAIVNRLWARFYGFGLVNPLDQMHEANTATHPELLDWLARDFTAHHYDLRRLIRGLVLSQAYARSSRYEGEDAPRPQLFAVARVRPLTPVQLATSLRLATTDPTTLTDSKPEQLEKRLAGIEESARSFASLFEQPHDDFQIGVSEALLFSNSQRIEKELLAEGGDRLVGRLKQLPDSRAKVDLAVRVVLSRPPSMEESNALVEYLDRRADRPVEACRQLVWALLTSAEFRFNY